MFVEAIRDWSLLGSAIALLSIPPFLLPWKGWNPLIRVPLQIGAAAIAGVSVVRSKKQLLLDAKLTITREAQIDKWADEYASWAKHPDTLCLETGTAEELPKLSTMPTLTWYPSVLVFGSQGSGKTTFVEEEVAKRHHAGHRVVVCDPHAAFGRWKSCEVVGGGMKYKEIDDKLDWFSREVKRRYEIFETQPNPSFSALTFICEEFTNWASRCKNSGEFFQVSLSDIRKVNLYVLIVSHSRTLISLGDAKGMAKLRDEALLEIELLGQQDPVSGKAIPRFEAQVKLPGQSQADRSLVKIPRKAIGGKDAVEIYSSVLHSGQKFLTETDCSQPVPRPSPEQSDSREEQLWSDGGTTVERLLGRLENALQNPGNTPLFEGVPREEKMQILQLMLKHQITEEKIILLGWGLKRGGRLHHKYQDARSMLNLMKKALGETNNGL